MSQPRRRRRRRRRGGQGGQRPPESQPTPAEQPATAEGSRQPQGRSRRRRRRGRGGQQPQRPTPKSSEDIVRAPAKKPPTNVLGPHDGTTLEDVIGELQSEWGVPQNPQEFRITLKVAEGKEDKSGGPATIEEVRDDRERDDTTGTGVDGRMREKAPAAPRIAASASGEEGPTRKSSRRRRSRRRKKR